MSTFETGKVTKKSPEQIDQIIKDGIKRSEGDSIAEVRRIYDGDSESLIGYELIHAEPTPRAPRKDKGVPRAAKNGQPTEPKGTEQAASAEKGKKNDKKPSGSPLNNSTWIGDEKSQKAAS